MELIVLILALMFALIPMIPIIVIGIFLIKIYIPFRNSEYRKESGRGFKETYFNKGNYSEFLIFTYLQKLDCHSKIMTNLYIPREDGTTTEVDIVMISTKGIFVFESKNYSGWIYGNEKNVMWTQTLARNNKYQFYNPVWQNAGHISAIKRALEDDRPELYKSYIVCGDRCTLKSISLDSQDVVILKRNTLMNSISIDLNNSKEILSEKEVFKYYWKLRYYRIATDKVKHAHVEAIRNRKNET